MIHSLKTREFGGQTRFSRNCHIEIDDSLSQNPKNYLVVVTFSSGSGATTNDWISI